MWACGVSRRYFDRDVECVARFFRRHFGYEREAKPKLGEIVNEAMKEYLAKNGK